MSKQQPPLGSTGRGGAAPRPGARLACTLAAALMVPAFIGGCPLPPDNGDGAGPVFNNSTDPTNGGASYIGSSACGACHPQILELNAPHGHTQALKPVQGIAPTYNPAGQRAGVPDPPAGKTWNNVSYVIGGYVHGAFFVDQDGFVMTDGVEGVNTQWNLSFPANGTAAGFVAYKPEQQTPLPYEFECFRCHTTGPRAQDAEHPGSQDGRPGIGGTWAEPGVRCEACHGPGSFHVPNPQARNIFVGPTELMCGPCHTGSDDPNVIAAANGLLAGNTQYAELLASGGHSAFACTVCHDPHASITYDRQRGLRNDCTACHPDMNMAFHDGVVFRSGDYVEQFNCQSCHMPLAGLTSSAAAAAVVGPEARIGDVRAHIFRINTTDTDPSVMFTADGTAVRKDAQGRAALTVNFVCLRCHNDAGSLFPLTIPGAVFIADGMHARAAALE